MQGLTFQNYHGEGINCYPIQISNGITDSLQASLLEIICDDILTAISSNFELSSFGITNHVCTRWKSVNGNVVVIASIFNRHYSKCFSPKTNEKFAEIVLANLDAFTFENANFLKMFEYVCDWGSSIKITDSELAKKLAFKLPDYLPEVEKQIANLPLAIYNLTSAASKIKLTDLEKIELLKLCAKKNPARISYNIFRLIKDIDIDKKDLIELAKICVKNDYRTLHYIKCYFGFEFSLLKEIQDENKIDDSDIKKIEKEAEKLSLS